MKTTITDIARIAGVSTATVSKILNRKGRVSDELRVRVEAIIERLNYRPSLLAQNVRSSRTKIIALVIPQILNTFYAQFIDAVERKVSQRGYSLVLSNTSESFEAELKYLEAYARMRVSGLILATSGIQRRRELAEELASYRSLDIPVVLAVRTFPDSGFHTVDLDNDGGAFEATMHLIRAGHERIAIISSAAHTSACQERISGYRRALESTGLAFDERLVFVGKPQFESGYQIIGRLLDMNPRPTAVFVASNIQLIGVLKALREAGVKIPLDLSLVCFDDTEWSALTEPALTVIRPDIEALGQASLDLIFDQLNAGAAAAPLHRLIGTELVARQSVRPCVSRSDGETDRRSSQPGRS